MTAGKGRAPRHGPEKSRWPTVFGIISIILASLGIFSGFGQATHALVMKAMGSVRLPLPTVPTPAPPATAPAGPNSVTWPPTTGPAWGPQSPPNPQAVFAGMSRHWAEMLALGLANTAVFILLLIAGIQLLRRRPGGYSMHRIYGALGVVLAVVGGWVSYRYFTGMMQGFASAAPTGAGMQGVMHMPGMLMGFVYALFAGVYPVIVLIYFSRSAVRDEVATWGR